MVGWSHGAKRKPPQHTLSKAKFSSFRSPASERVRREGLSLMRVPECIPKRSHSPGNATAVLRGLVCSAQERAKTVAYQVRTTRTRGWKHSSRGAGPARTRSKLRHRAKWPPLGHPTEGERTGKGKDVKSPPSRVSCEGEGEGEGEGRAE